MKIRLAAILLASLLAAVVTMHVGRAAGIETAVAAHPDDPVEISAPTCERGVDTLLTCHARLRNTSPKGVTAYGVRWVVSWPDGHEEKIRSTSDRLLGTGKPFAPGEFLADASFGIAIHAGVDPLRVVAELEFVEFEDRSLHGNADSPAYLTVVGERHGARLMRNRLREVYLRQGLAALLKEIGVDTP